MDAKHALELEIENLKGQLAVMKHIKEDDLEVLKKVEDIHKNLRDKKEEFEDLESLTRDLVVHQRKSNDELQDARKEVINVSVLKFYRSTHFPTSLGWRTYMNKMIY